MLCVWSTFKNYMSLWRSKNNYLIQLFITFTDYLLDFGMMIWNYIGRMGQAQKIFLIFLVLIVRVKEWLSYPAEFQTSDPYAKAARWKKKKKQEKGRIVICEKKY